MKNLIKLSLIALILGFSGCATVDRGNFGQFEIGKRSSSYKNSYDVIDTSKENISIPKSPVNIVEKFEVVSGGCAYLDCDKGKERKELKRALNDRDTFNGSEYWYTWSIYFPKDYKTLTPGQTTLGQFYGKTSNLDMHSKYMFVENDGYRIKKPSKGNLMPEILISPEDLRSKWHTIKVYVKWSKRNDGKFKVWVNSILKIDWIEKTMDKNMIFFKYGIYRDNIHKYKAAHGKKIPYNIYTKVNDDIEVPTQIVYYSNVRRANTEKGLITTK